MHASMSKVQSIRVCLIPGMLFVEALPCVLREAFPISNIEYSLFVVRFEGVSAITTKMKESMK